jgi:hypothetical protein
MLSPDNPVTPPRLLRHCMEDAWIQLYQRAGDPAVALEVVHQLDLDPAAQRYHQGLYVLCRVTVRQHHERLLRHDRVIRGLCTPARRLVAAAATLVRALGGRQAVAPDVLQSLRSLHSRLDLPTAGQDRVPMVAPGLEQEPNGAPRAPDAGAVPLREVA